MTQKKQVEISFFNKFAEHDRYNVFTDETNNHIINKVIELGRFQSGDRIADLGCGSGVFTHLLGNKNGLKPIGIDISDGILGIGKNTYPELSLTRGDVEQLPFADNIFDGVSMMALVHHFPNLHDVVNEVYRILKPGGRFVTFDPNRRNPFMYLYRDRSSPFYSPVGVTENERPILIEEVYTLFENAGFKNLTVDHLSSIQYRYVESPLMRKLLPIYNKIESTVFQFKPLHPHSSFVLLTGQK